MRIIFETMGDRSTASSRLRAWKLADELGRRGYETLVGEVPASGRKGDIWIFQKRMKKDSITKAVRGRGTVVYDFDDNYLLEGLGTRERTIAAMNEAHLVTVGSTELFEAAQQLHERPWLLENPIDVSDETLIRPEMGWREKIVWFGNRTNLMALDNTGIRRKVTTITQRGDVEWSLGTVDKTLIGYDLAVLPVEPDSWTVAKNANRLIKCVALGLPVLASATDEHIRVVEEMGLPESLLVGERDDWDRCIEGVVQAYGEVRDQVLNARDTVYKRWGISRIVDDWLDQILAISKGDGGEAELRSWGWTDSVAQQSTSSSNRSMDTLIVDDGIEGDWRRTVRSVKARSFTGRITVIGLLGADEGEVEFGGVEYVQASDPFDLYGRVATYVGSVSTHSALIMRAGAELRPGFVSDEAIHSGLSGSGPVVFQVQRLGGSLDTLDPPRLIQEVLRYPYAPPCLMLPRDFMVGVGEDLGKYGALIPWYLLIRCLYDGGFPLYRVVDPFVVAVEGAMSPQPVVTYFKYLQGIHSPITGELPKAEFEWERLRWIWSSAVVENAKAAYGEHATSIIPYLQERAMSIGGGKKAGTGSVGAEGAQGVVSDAGLGLGVRHEMVRLAWRAIRPVVPDGMRKRLFESYKHTYYKFFPDRKPI